MIITSGSRGTLFSDKLLNFSAPSLLQNQGHQKSMVQITEAQTAILHRKESLKMKHFFLLLFQQKTNEMNGRV
jgi:hypothetical protein